jgi:hypothetical protein
LKNSVAQPSAAKGRGRRDISKVPGCVDNAECGIVAGWVFDPNSPSTRLQVSLAIDGSTVAEVEASEFRKDLVGVRESDGRCGFAIKFTDSEWRHVSNKHKSVSISARNPDSGLIIPISPSQRVQFFLEQGNSRQTFLPESLPPKAELSAVCIIKNEALYVDEWIAYHLIKGVQFFLFFDNGSTDNLIDVLSPYIQKGIALMVPWPNFVNDVAIRRRAWHEQNVAYLNALRALAYISAWVVVLDIDEFLVTEDDICITELLNEMPERDVVTLYWKFFGSGGRETRPTGLVVENFVFRDADRLRDAGMPYKFVVRPERVGWILNTHIPFMAADGAIGENSLGKRFWTGSSALSATDFSTMWINHYHVKSKEEYKQKVVRGWPENTDGKNFDWEGFFNLHDRNEAKDTKLFDFGNDIRTVIAGMRRASVGQPDVLNWPRSLIIQLDLKANDNHLLIVGLAFDCNNPGVPVRVEVQDFFRNALYAGACHELSPIADAFNFCDGRIGFNISVALERLPFNQVHIVFNGSVFSRTISRAILADSRRHLISSTGRTPAHK